MFAALKSLIKTISLPGWLRVLPYAAAFLTGMWVQSRFDAADRLHEMQRQQAARAAIEQRMNEASRETAATEQRLRIYNRQITAIMERELAKDAYRCPVPADGVRLLNDAAAAANAAR